MAAKVEKVSVAIGLEDLAWARERADREGASLSSVLTAAIRATRERETRLAHQRRALDRYLAWATKGKPLTAEEIEAAQRELDGE
jgi:Arc/MetJ-type ribon-helix-helix transcriptional regulator